MWIFIVLKKVKKSHDISHHTTRTTLKTNQILKKEERRKKRLCFKCGEAGHMQFNCPNRMKPKNFKMINKVPNKDPSSSALLYLPHLLLGELRKLKSIISTKFWILLKMRI